jgi:branched-chain amino acid transport system ATP-binding protein
VSGAPALRTSALTVTYGGVTANEDVELDVDLGEVVGLIGPNGAGKTTFIDAVSGFTRCTGKVWAGADRVDHMSPHERRRVGIARTWQAGELFTDLSVAENLEVACRAAGVKTVLGDLLRAGRPKREQDVTEALAAVALSDAADRRPGDLSLGEQKLVGVARALVGKSKVLLLDEPAAGLDTEESQLLGKQLRRIATSGYAALLVDHDMGLVLEVCDRVYVLDFGRIISEGTPKEIVADPAVVAAYLGSPESQAAHA